VCGPDAQHVIRHMLGMQAKAHAAALQQLQTELQQEHKQDTALLVAQHAASLETDLDTRAAKVHVSSRTFTYWPLHRPASKW
jgi:hypothetical protein